MSKTLRLGFIGGSIKSAVGNVHRIASQMDDRWELVAGCFSKDKKINKETAEIYKVEKDRVYNDWKYFLMQEKDNLDAVSILTPTNMHYEMVMYALSLGYAVICEKALSSSYRQAIDISNFVEKNNSFLVVTYNYTGYPMLRELREMIKKDILGNIYQIIIEMPQEGFIRLNSDGEAIIPQDWRLIDDEIPTISLDLGTHLHNIVYFLCGEKPIEVVSDETTYGNFKQIIDNVMCIVRYSGNIRCQMWYSKSALGNRNGLKVRVFGEKGGAEWFQMEPEQLKVCDVYGNYRIIDRASKVCIANQLRYNRFKSGHPAGFIEAYANHYYDIADSLIEYNEKGKIESPFVFDVFQATEGLKLFQSIRESSKENKWIKI